MSSGKQSIQKTKASAIEMLPAHSLLNNQFLVEFILLSCFYCSHLEDILTIKQATNVWRQVELLKTILFKPTSDKIILYDPVRKCSKG